MPTLQNLGVHPEVCDRLMVAKKKPKLLPGSSSNNNGVADENGIPSHRRHRVLTPQEIVMCPLDSFRMSLEDGRVVPVSLSHASRLKSEVIEALISFPEKQQQQQHDDERNQDNQISPNLSRKGLKTTGHYSAVPSVRNWMARMATTPRAMPIFLSTGCSPLDHLLSSFSGSTVNQAMGGDAGGGGIALGYVTGISGPPESGKTRFVCSMTTQFNQSGGNSWLICFGSLGPHVWRLQQLRPSSPQKRLVFHPNTTMRTFLHEWDIFSILTELETQFQQQQQHSQNHNNKPCLVVFDSFPSLGWDADLMQRIWNRIRYVARCYGVAILVVDETLGKEPFHRKNQGSSSSCLADVQLSFQRSQGNNHPEFGQVLWNSSSLGPVSLPIRISMVKPLPWAMLF